MIAALAVDSKKFKGELVWRYSKRAAGTPIKKLPAEEMSRETECRKRSPSVIARLMGLDGFPPQQLSHKQQKRSSENYLQRITLTEDTQWSVSSCSRRSSRKSSKEEQEFKDVFEVSDSSKKEISGCSFQETSNSKLTEPEMAFIRQKFVDAKHLSVDEKFHDLKEFHDAIDDLESNKDLLLKFLEQSDPLLTKHIHDLQSTTQSKCHRISGMNPPGAPECRGSGLDCKIERETPRKNRRKYHNNPPIHSYNKHAAEDSLNPSKFQLEGKAESSAFPTRIVVLKPNFGKVLNATRATSTHPSCDFLSDGGREIEIPGVKSRRAELCEKKRLSDDSALPRYKSRESREIAKEITRKMRNNLGGGSIKLSASSVRGYAGDESSSSRSAYESANESDAPTSISRNSIGWSNRCRPSSSCSAESSVNREARKRLSDRWKKTHKSIDMGVVNRGSTLGEMLAMPDRDPRPANADAMVSENGFSGKFDGRDGTVEYVEPLGISSRDGWKDGYVRSLSRSRSVPAACTVVGTPNKALRRETLFNERLLLPKQVMQQERVKAVKGNFNQREGSSSRSSRSRIKKSHFSECSHTDLSDTSMEIHFGHNQVQSSVTDDDPFKQCHMASETSATVVKDMCFVPKNAVELTTENVAMPSKPTVPVLPAYMMVKGDSSSSDTEVLVSQKPSNGLPDKKSVPIQHSLAEVQSPASSKESEQPSPVSVLETPFPDDLSTSSECFESLSADLHGLRMQLQLLKLESEAYAEGPMLISSDEDVDEDSIGFSEMKGVAEESREFSYVVDVLLESGINDADPNTFMASWHSPECPVNPLVFEELEKKHSNLTSWPRSERKLLFDRINLSLLAINQQFADLHPWVRLSTRIIPRWIENTLDDEIRKLLASQDKKTSNDAAESVLVMDSQWLNLRDDVDVVGREIERLLMEELVEEI